MGGPWTHLLEHGFLSPFHAACTRISLAASPPPRLGFAETRAPSPPVRSTKKTAWPPRMSLPHGLSPPPSASRQNLTLRCRLRPLPSGSLFEGVRGPRASRSIWTGSRAGYGFDPSPSSTPAAQAQPARPLGREDRDNVRVVAKPREAPFLNPHQTEPVSFAQGVLHTRAADAGERRDMVDGKAARTPLHHLEGDDGKNRLLGQGEPACDLRRQAP